MRSSVEEQAELVLGLDGGSEETRRSAASDGATSGPRRQAIARTTPPSTRNAAPVVADACALHT